MEVVRDRIDSLDVHILRQLAVDGQPQLFRGDGGIQFYAGHLPAGMYAGIRATGPDDRNFLLGRHLPQGRFQFSLDGPLLALELPSVESRAIVLNEQLEI
jgi:hypothetical protein